MSLCMRRGTGQINQLDATRTIPSRGVVAAGSRTPYFPPFSTQVVSLSGPLCSRTPPSPPFPLQRVSRRSVAACLPFGSAGYQQLGSLPFGGAVCNVLLMIVLVLVRVCFVLVAAKSSLAPFFVHFDCTMPVDPRSSLSFGNSFAGTENLMVGSRSREPRRWAENRLDWRLECQKPRRAVRLRLRRNVFLTALLLSQCEKLPTAPFHG